MKEKHMTKAIRFSVGATILLIGIFSAIIAGFSPRFVKVKAETIYYSAEQYTVSDQLLLLNGT